eukprot:snap_masked-scaffold_12-processed-gene-12.14-mRNA-1 protein AED:1.00 eAED:1.00 QI:0/0/0/0/1/1/2/0/59
MLSDSGLFGTLKSLHLFFCKTLLVALKNLIVLHILHTLRDNSIHLALFHRVPELRDKVV